MKQKQSQYFSISHGDPLPADFFSNISWSKIIQKAANHHKGIIYVQGENKQVFQTYAELLINAQKVLKGLRNEGLKPQDKIILQFRDYQQFFMGFWACLLGGFIPIPITIPDSFEYDQSKSQLLIKAVKLCPHSLILTEQNLESQLSNFVNSQNLNNCQIIALENLLNYEKDENFYQSNLDDLTLLLLTSGSTGMPKAVMLNSRNLFASIYGMATFNNLNSDDISLNWMALEHVASLVMFHLTQVYLGSQQIHVSKDLILQNPLKWLDLIDQFRVTITWAPNFGYSLINDQLQKQKQKQRCWDLCCVRWMGNGAQVVVNKTIKKFLTLLSPYNLAEDVISPGFGMSETCSGITHAHNLSLSKLNGQDFVEVGLPIPGISLRIVNEQNEILSEQNIGFLQVKGLTITQGYYQQSELNQTLFTADGWLNTGDLGYLKNGCLTITGRQKEVIIINGVNYYSHDIETLVETISEISVSYTCAMALTPLSDACVTDSDNEQEILGIFFHHCLSNDSQDLLKLILTIRKTVVQEIGINPTYLIPVDKKVIPKTSLGKIERNQLKQRFQAGEFNSIINQIEDLISKRKLISPELPSNIIEEKLVQIWQEILQIQSISIYDNFFEVGGNSLKLMQLLNMVNQYFNNDRNRNITITDLFQYPNISSLANYLNSEQKTSPLLKQSSIRGKSRNKVNLNKDIAVIGMSGRFPGADNLEEFWQNLCNGVESISFFDDQEILDMGINPRLLEKPNYVKASPIIKDIEYFDADFFGYTDKEAELIDPQHRLFLECAYESLVDAGYNPFDYAGDIGIYGGCAGNTYLLNNIYPNLHLLGFSDSSPIFNLNSLSGFQMSVANDKDYLTTRVSYKLNLTGPSVNIQTACSTSLVAIHFACQSLINGECDMALAGAVSLQIPQKIGYLYQEGMILSPDGHCRAFDEKAEGTIFGSGVGMVVLKPLDLAIANEDKIYAVIKGTAINNDGGKKVNYLATNGLGQSRVITEALEVAQIDPHTVGYIETHGTGTKLGDPIEIEALSEAFREKTSQTNFCAIGSVKTNVGHLQMASGIVGFIKTVLSIYHRKIPPSLHFNKANQQINFTKSPFYVNTKLQNWSSDNPLRAGVNSLGIGGTNAHLILEQAPNIDLKLKKPSFIAHQFKRKKYWLEMNNQNFFEENNLKKQAQNQAVKIESFEITTKSDTKKRLMNLIISEVAKIIGINELDTIDIKLGFMELGLDSLGSIELKNSLEKTLNLTLSSAIIFDYSSISEIVDYLLTVMFTVTSDNDSAKLNEQSEAIEKLSEVEAEILLMEELKKLNPN